VNGIVVWQKLGIRIRLALLYSGIFAIGLVAFCLVLFRHFENSGNEAFNTTLYNFAVDVSNNLEMDFVGRLFVVNSSVVEEDKVLPFHLGKIFLEIRDPSGRILVYSRSLKGQNLPYDPKSMPVLTEKKAIFSDVQVNGVKERLLTYLAYRADWGRPLILQLAVPLDFPRQEMRELLFFFLLAIPIVLVIAAIAGFLISQRALAPVKAMTGKAQDMGLHGKLSDRIPVPGPHDEIRELAETFNDLLGRLEMAFDSQERFISNASHQLKTPLTILKGELNMIKKRQVSESGVKEFFESATAEIEHMINLVEDLLLLARLEAGKDTLSMNKVGLDEVLLGVVSRLQKIAAQKNVQIQAQFISEPPDKEFQAEVLGDEELLACLLENLVENAVKYSPKDSSVTVRLIRKDGRVEFSVKDQGPGIPEAMRDKIFERFHRGFPSSFVAGSGLGLTIASQIAKLHEVKIQVGDNEGGGTAIAVDFSV
jgi:signal transduction histidine kinase